MMDDCQNAILRCLVAGYAVAEDDPYSDRRFHSALRTAKADAARRRGRSATLLNRYGDTLPERSDSDKRYRSEGLASTNPAEQISASEEARILRDCVEILPQRERQVVDQRLEGRSDSEIAAGMQQTESAVRSLGYRAHHRLRENLMRRGVTA